ncbi:lysophospholipase [Mumia sp. zg.B53]|uniref:alpha/beta hydrolase n=1 Tax=unclassified Mumia TaxID=2621872 RepID=UPI001C6EDAF7|nr:MULTISPECIES: alpha/beta hydrolase [unclassified Mumia]MBW9209945.1 lysophospholipase [Mumia sp. zg.B21]MBW9214549.1 lysophospholipase [Mumia sp. zg.B53]MDD9347670.1 lysophospholipase [Mumia sp.]
MTAPTTTSYEGHLAPLVVHRWAPEAPRWIAVLVHGYAEHLGRYQHVAQRLVDDGALVVGPDHLGHGASDGERVLIPDFGPVIADLHGVVEQARTEHPGLPVVMIGHSMGGMIAARYGQRFGDELAALILSGPVLGSWRVLKLAERAEIPDLPIDPSTLSRDPGVGEAYAADPLVWHGRFRRETLIAVRLELARIGEGPRLGSLPTLWMHGEDDAIVPIGPTREGIERIKGDDFTDVTYPGARHEIFNETNQDEVLATTTAFALAHV